ncbi:glycosyltransferase family 4 protein [Neisseria dentiae]|uniref:glycosyltransferase family 4 protein n=1 Tax=Neisseria dentiae TaxID=194197 RepID=UPI0035A05BCB
MKNQATVLFLESSKNMGGQEWQLLQQMQALQEHDYRCILLCRPESRIIGEASSRGLPTVALPFRNSAHLPTIAGIRRTIRQYRPSACICHSGHDSNNLSLAVLWMRPRPKIIRSRTYYVTEKKKTFQSLLPVDIVMVPSRFMQQRIQQQYPDRPVQTVYPGIDFSRLDSQKNDGLPNSLENWLSQRPDHHILIQVGMLRTEKGHSTALHAIAGLLRQRQDISYIIAGTGENHTSITQEINRLGLQEHIWMGELKPVAPALQRASLLLMPSSKEPLGMAQIEALGLGIPVIVSNADGIPETVQHQQTGLVVDGYDPDSWQQAILYALEHYPLMQQYAAEGQKTVRQKFSIAANTEQLIRLITS